jgi:hypothetical protein
MEHAGVSASQKQVTGRIKKGRERDRERGDDSSARLPTLLQSLVETQTKRVGRKEEERKSVFGHLLRGPPPFSDVASAAHQSDSSLSFKLSSVDHWSPRHE